MKRDATSTCGVACVNPRKALLDDWYRYVSGWISPRCVGQLSERRIVTLAGQTIHIATPSSGLCAYENPKWAIEEFLFAVGLSEFATCVYGGTKWKPPTPYKERKTRYIIEDPRYFSEHASGKTWVKWKWSKFMEWVVDGPPIPKATDGPIGTWCLLDEREVFGSDEKSRVFHTLNALNIDSQLYSGKRSVNENDVIDMMANALRLQTKGMTIAQRKHLTTCNQ